MLNFNVARPWSWMNRCLSSLKREVKMQERTTFDFPSKVLNGNRYCNQDDFSILVCGGKNEKKQKCEKCFQTS